MMKFAFSSMAFRITVTVANIVVIIPVTTWSLIPDFKVSTVVGKGALGIWAINKSIISPTVYSFLDFEKAVNGLEIKPDPIKRLDVLMKFLLLEFIFWSLLIAELKALKISKSNKKPLASGKRLSLTF